jgi:eukaryotic-like serine/threonine-protein kinase
MIHLSFVSVSNNTKEMGQMDLYLLNSILSFLEIGYSAINKLPVPVSGQRQAYLAADKKGCSDYVIKISPLFPITVARIQREINILSNISSEYFPKFYFHSFITEENLNDFCDNLDPKTQKELLSDFNKAEVKPFLLTIERYIINIPWKDCVLELKEEGTMVNFLIDVFNAMKLLWDAQIVHRDLKPDNILIRPNRKPVIIDLGIAKSFKEGTMDLTGVFFHTPCTPRFAAPEQLFNNRTEITYKTDQFSIGIIAFWLLTDKYPYGEVEVDGLEQVLENMANKKIYDAAALKINPRLLQLVLKLIQVEPYKRFRNVEYILTELCEIKEELAC